MAHSFSAASLSGMEAIFDRHVFALRSKLDASAAQGVHFDMKMFLNFYAYDVLCQLAFSADTQSQARADPAELPPIDDHILLSVLLGSMTTYMPWLGYIGPYLPSQWIRKLYVSRRKLVASVRSHVQRSMAATEKDNFHDRTLLSHLIAAQDPETGEKLSEVDVATEAFAFFIAGAHTTAGSLGFLLYHILHNPEVHKKVVDEALQELPYKAAGSYDYTGLESRLPYLTACIREGFRMSPVFTMLLPRVVVPEDGIEIDGHLLPRGVSDKPPPS
jgi:cytochrome P450